MTLVQTSALPPHSPPIDRAWWTRLACLVLAVLPSEQVLHAGADDPALVEELAARGVDAFGLCSAGHSSQPRSGAERFRAGSLEDARDQAQRYSTVLCSIPVTSAESVVEELVPSLASICSRHALLLIHGHDTHPVSAVTQQRIRERMYRAGFRRHPSELRFRAFDSSGAGYQTLIFAFERIPASTAACPPPPDLPQDLLTGPDASAAEARFLLAAHLIGRHDVVVHAACGAGAGSAMLYDNSTLCARVIAIDDRDAALAHAAHAYGSTRNGLSFVRGDVEQLRPVPDASADVVVSLDPEWTGTHGERFLEHALRVLIPGGRLIVALPPAAGNDSAAPIFADLRRLFLVDGVFAQVASTDDRAGISSSIVAVDAERAAGITPACWIAVAIKDPIAHQTPRPESIDHPRQRLADVDIAASTEGFANPWLPNGIVRFDLRPENPEVLAGVALRALEQSPDYSPDRGAALAVLGYRRLEGRESESSRSLPVEAWIEAFVAHPPRTPQEIRWCISNQYLLARLHLRSGRLREAEEAFVRCASLERTAHAALLATGVSSCALIATKTVDAAFWAGWLASRRHDRAAARDRWTQGIASAGRAVIDGWDSYTGRRITVRPYGLYEASVILEAASRCEEGLAWLDLDDERLGDLPMRSLRDGGDYRLPVPYVSGEAIAPARTSQADVIALLLHHVSRPIYVWGAGAMGRRFAAVAGERFARVTAFIDSAPDKRHQTILGKSIFTPEVLSGTNGMPRPFVIVASLFASEILASLAARRLQPPEDVFVFGE